MNVNANSRFSSVPQVSVSRSKFDMSTRNTTTFNVGDLIPFYYEEVLPGDTFSVDTNILARMQPLVVDPMDDLYLDFYYFFVPNRIVWEHWKEFMGENMKSAWYPTPEYNVPHVKFGGALQSPPLHSVADYFGVPVPPSSPTVVPEFTCSQLPFRAYALIWNEWFRDENLQDPVLVDLGDSDVPFDSTHKGYATYGGTILRSNRYHDYFSSCLPQPQKGPDVMLPIGNAAYVYPVYGEIADKISEGRQYDVYGLEMRSATSGYDIPAGNHSLGIGSSAGTSGSGDTRGVYASIDSGGSGSVSLAPSNLVADLSGVSGATINALRLALSTQAFYEKNARGGTRYRELIKSHFGVTSPDGRQQVPELLNYNRVVINFNQVVQQSSSTDDSPLAHQAAYALTADSDNSFTKSFTEHGMVIGVCTARFKHSYQQGLNKRFSRRTMFDYYFPVFANLGEQPVLNKELYVSTPDKNEEVFGYQEAFADYRYHPDIVTSEMRSGVSNSLDVWHWADYYSSLPALSSAWLQEQPNNVDRSLVVNHTVSDQIFCDIYVENTAVRCMPMYSIPGLPRTL